MGTDHMNDNTVDRKAIWKLAPHMVWQYGLDSIISGRVKV